MNAIDPADPSGKSGWSDKEVASVWMPEGVPSLKETKRAAQDMLGEVHGESLLKELYLRELKSTHVRQGMFAECWIANACVRFASV